MKKTLVDYADRGGGGGDSGTHACVKVPHDTGIIGSEPQTEN